MNKIIALFVSMSFLAGCVAKESYRLDGRPRTIEGNLLKQTIQTPYKGDGGVVIARTNTVGPVSAISVDNGSPDCASAVSLGITVESAIAKESFLFDKDGKPCDKAKIIFNGNDKIHQRATPQNIGISFVDRLGPLPSQQQEVLDLVVPMHITDKPENYSILPNELMTEIQPVYDTGPDNLEKAVGNWNEAYERERVLRESEKLLADIRNVSRLSSTALLDAHQRKIVELSAKLRAAEKNTEFQNNRQQSLINKLHVTQNRADSAMMSHDNESAKLTGDLEQLRSRLSQMDEANKRVKHSYKARENIYKKQINELASDLRVAEVQASSSRQAIVMEAAKKIAEAERLAYAARVVEKDAMEREASRLKREADTLMNRAIDLGKGRQIILPGMSHIPDFQKDGYRRDRMVNKQKNALPPLETLQVNLREEDKTLEDIFKKALKYIEPKAGKWRVSWELSEANMGIPLEEWSIVAETPFNEFLAYVATKVRETNKVKLKFERFDKNKLFVISD